MKQKYVKREYKDIVVVFAAATFLMSWVTAVTQSSAGYGKTHLWVVAIISTFMLFFAKRWRFAEYRAKLREKEMKEKQIDYLRGEE